MTQKETDGMTLSEVIDQLEDLKEHCLEMTDSASLYEDVWQKDTEALTRAVEILELFASRHKKSAY